MLATAGMNEIELEGRLLLSARQSRSFQQQPPLAAYQCQHEQGSANPHSQKRGLELLPKRSCVKRRSMTRLTRGDRPRQRKREGQRETEKDSRGRQQIIAIPEHGGPVLPYPNLPTPAETCFCGENTVWFIVMAGTCAPTAVVKTLSGSS